MHSDSTSFVNPVRKALRNAAAPFTTASFRDLEKMDLTRYKELIFCHPFDLDHGKLEFIRKVAAGKTVVWIWAPGIVHDGKWDPENMRRIAGGEFGSRELLFEHDEVFKCKVFVPAPKELDDDDMWTIHHAAGVHFWCDGRAPVCANGRLVSIHLAAAMKTTLQLPRRCAKVTELFSGREYRDVQEIELEVAGPETLLFRYGEE